MDFFFDTIKELDIKFQYQNKKDYIVKEYENGEVIYENLKRQYDVEIKDYIGKDKNFEDIFGGKLKDF